MIRRSVYIFAPVILLLVTCSSPQSNQDPHAGASALERLRWLSSSEAEADSVRALREQATLFDKFLNNGLSAEERVMLEDACVGNPEKNIFCFSVLNYQYFEDKKTQLREAVVPRRRVKRVTPAFNKKGAITNWNELKFAPVASLLTPVSQLSTSRFALLKKKVLADHTCPLNVAIAAASALEDKLPAQASRKDIGLLYEKGADCLKTQRADRASLLTRAGLFYYLEKDYQKAFDVFLKASWVQNIVNSRPLYWKYRAEMELGKKDDANQTLETLISRYPFSFHTIVAQTAVQSDPGVLLEKPHTRFERSKQVPTINLLIEQVEVLTKLGFEPSARAILDWAVIESDGAEPELKIYLAELKEGDSKHLQQIQLLSDVLLDNPHLISKKSMELYFPKPYFPIFEKNSAGIDPFLLLAIARQESAFNPKAISSANAMGLLQIVPRTARRVNNTSRSELLVPETNIEAGAKYFHQLLKSLNGNIHFAMAAYNAGPKKLNEWVKRYPTEDPILFIDVLPYRETRDYVALVLRNYYWYRRMHGAPGDNQAISKAVLELKQTLQ